MSSLHGPDAFDDVGAAPELWASALQAVTTAFGGLAGGIRSELPTGAVSQVWWGLPDDFERKYLDHYHRLDPWMPTARALPVGRCVPSQSLVADAVLNASEFYQDFLRPRGLREIVGGIVERTPDGGITTFAVMRADGECAFDQDDATRLEHFLPRIRQALWIDRRLSELESARLGNGVATFVLDANRAVAAANSIAAELLSAGDAVVEVGGRLQAVCPLSESALSRALHDAWQPGLGGFRPRPVAIRRPSGPALIACVSRLTERVSSARIGGPRPGLLVVIHDPFEPVDLDPVEARLRSLYQLTAAEARVAALVGSGHSPAETAARLRITTGTTRYQLKQVYSRIGLDGQRGLVRLVSALSRL